MQLDSFVPVEQKQDKLAPFLSAQYANYHEGAKNSLAMMRSITKAKKEPTYDNPVIEIQNRFIEERSKDEKAIRHEAARDYFNNKQKALNKSIAQVPPQTADEVDDLAEVAQENFLGSQQLDRVEKDFLSTLAPEVAKQRLDIEADRLFVFNEMANVMEEVGYGKLAKDIGGIFLINNMSFNTAEIAEGNYLTSAGDLKKRIEVIRNIPDATERRAAIVDMIQRIKDTTGNSLDQIDYLSRIAEPRDTTVEETLDKAALAVDGLTVIGIGSTFIPAAVAGVSSKALVSGMRVADKVSRFFDAIRDTNPIKAAKNVGATEDAAALSNVAAKSSEAADAMGVSQDVAAANHLPFAFEGILPGAADGLAAKLVEFSAEAQKIRELIDGDLIREGLKLTPEEASNFVKKAEADLKAGDDVVNVRPIEATPNGWKFEVEYTNKPNPNDANPPKFKRIIGSEFAVDGFSLTKTTQGWKLYQGQWNNPNRTYMDTFATKTDAESFIKQNNIPNVVEEIPETTTRSVIMEWDETDLGGYKIAEEGIGQVKGFMASPNIKFFTDRLHLVLPAVRTQYQQARLRKALDQMYRDAYAPLGNKYTPKYKRSKQKLDELLQLGDQWDNGPMQPTGRRFTYSELKEGILTPEGRRVSLSEQEIESYYKTRMLMDNLHHIEDMRLVETAKQRGIQKVEINGNEKLAKPYISARAAFTAAGDNWVWNSATNRVGPMDYKQIEEAYNRGYQLVRAEDYEDIVDAAGQAHASRFLLVNSENLKGTPTTMLNYREGYLPKISDDGVFFVKEGKKRLVNGREMVTNKSTLGMFTTKKAADAYRAKKTEQAIQAAMANGRTREQAQKDVGDLYETLRDREIPEGNISDPALFGQSPYTGARSTREIFLDEEGNMPVRINAYDAIQRAIRHASDSYPMSLLRHNLQQRWLASAKPHLPPEYQHDFNQAIQHITADQTGDIYRALQQTHSYIRHVVGAPSDAQLKTRHSIQRMADRFEDRMPRVSALLNKYSQHKDPTQLARTVTFHSLLGGFNMSQFIVQGMGSTVAMSIDPKNYVRSTQLAMAMNALDQTRTPKEFAAVKALLTKSKFIDADELENVYDGWRRSGLKDDLLNTADYSEFSRSWEMGVDMLRAGTLPFRMGEAAHRRYTFANSYLQTAKGKALDDETLKLVMNRQTDLSLNMSRMNKAAWQEGAVLGVATQFRQVTAKYIEMMAGGILKPEEKAALVLGQMALFGFHGVPAGTAIQQVVQGSYGWDKEDFPPEFQRFLNEGTVRLAMDAVGLEDINVVGRLALGESIVDLWNTTSVDSLIDFLGGPFASHVGSGVLEGIKAGTDTLRFMSSGDYSPKAKYESAEDYVEKVMRGIPIVDDLTTAYWYSKGVQLDKKGRTISEGRDISWAEVVALAAGFSDRAPSDIYISQTLRRKSDDRINTAVDTIAGMARKRFATGEGLSDVDKERIRFLITINSENEDEELRIAQLVTKALMEEPRLEREMNALFSFLFDRGQTVGAGATSELMLQTREQAEEIQ